MSEMYSPEGIEKLKIPFSRNCFSTRKGTCQGYIEFVEFLEFLDDFGTEEKRRVKLPTLLKKAYDSFSRGVVKDDAVRRAKLSESIRNGKLPTCSEVLHVYNYLEAKVSSSPDPGGEDFKDFVAFVVFSLVKRCAVRPGALSGMTIGEFLRQIYVDDKTETILVHVQAQKVSTYNDTKVCEAGGKIVQHPTTGVTDSRRLLDEVKEGRSSELEALSHEPTET